MFASGKALYLLIPSESNERVLIEGKVLETDAQNVVAQFAEPLPLVSDADVNLYADFRGRFYQQGASVAALRETDAVVPSTPIIALRKVGEMVSADNRASYRVSTANLHIHADIATEKTCKVVDISPEGFAVITSHDYAVGSVVNASLVSEGLSCSGAARVQTLKTLPNGARRYGFLALDPKGANMRKVLGQITATVQRLQLRRLSRTG